MSQPTPDQPEVLPVLCTGQETCHDSAGTPVPCEDSGQDAALRVGQPWPQPRFSTEDIVVVDRLTQLTWLRNANIAEFPFTWHEALQFVEQLNDQHHAGFQDWRLPNCRELRSLISYQTRKPALPSGHPFERVYPSWYWTETTAAINQDYAWYVNMSGGRMFYGHKQQSYLLWPVRGPGRLGPALDASPRFTAHRGGFEDRRTGLIWDPRPDTLGGPCTWQAALDQARAYRHGGFADWRLPNINELESLVDYRRARPALPVDHPFEDVPEAVWTSTTSMYEPDWAWALYLHKGACGVGKKCFPHYQAWLVRGLLRAPPPD